MGTSRHFFCYANASIPLELVTWLKDGVEVQSTKYIVNKSVIFQLNAAAVTDSGNYSCVQGNQLLGSVYVTVGDIPPKVENLHCYSHYQGENRCEWSPIPNSENNLQTNYNCTCYEEYQGATVIGKVTNSTCNLDDRLNSATTCSLTILSYNVLGSVAVTKSLTFNYISVCQHD
ncbi:uncharacterized protein LOC117108766 [Anneissia japonica]|uniref:uncharacterized protein LOC117108766 n=1 Tax=Anneissia japonica TaxID=1529436 RepID=UPI001425BAFD|nr:uncharacterized protein LOC117108766 [Anneissia japonica]